IGGDVDRNALSGDCMSHDLPMYLQGANTPALQDQRRSGGRYDQIHQFLDAEAAGQERSGRNGSMTTEREGPIDGEKRRGGIQPGREQPGSFHEFGAKEIQPFSRTGTDANNRGRFEWLPQLPDVFLDE